ncbi:ABC transporter substrate-binding protein [Modestobacter lapidis]|nr:ABC transporter substrate-binding protein [Modestobacter lapidis]
MKRPLVTSVCLMVALAATSCGKAEEQSGGSAGGAAEAVPGVTEDTITLGSLMDLTAVFASNSRSILQGTNLYWDAVNADGGVCDRQVELDVQDHGYDAQTAVSLYQTMSGNVLAIAPVLGSSVITALRPSFQEDNMLVGMAAWTSDVLPDPQFQITGTTYDIETINAIDWLTREHGLTSGDSIGVVYFEGDFGGSSLRGAEYAAEELGLTVVPHQIKPSDTDLSAQVNAMANDGVKAIIVAAASPQTASIASVAASIGLDVPIVGNGPAFTPDLLDTPAGAALEQNFYTATSMAPPSLEEEGVQEFLTAYQAEYPDEEPIQNGAMYGYASSQIIHEVLTRACEEDALTREGLQEALRSITDYESGGTVAGVLDYSDPSVPPTREIYISRADPAAAGGLTAVGDSFVSELAEGYEFTG